MRIYTDYKRTVQLTGSSIPAGNAKASGGRPPIVTDTPTNILQNYVERLISVVPGEVIISYPIIKDLLTADKGALLSVDSETSIAGVTAVALTILLRTIGLAPYVRPQITAVVISTIACILWVYHEGGHIIYNIPSTIIDVIILVFVMLAAKVLHGEKRIIP